MSNIDTSYVPPYYRDIIPETGGATPQEEGSFISDVSELFPNIYSGVVEFNELAAAENPIISIINSNLAKMINNQFVLTMNLEYIVLYESLLKIQADKYNESIDFRRARILNRLSQKAPITLNAIKNRLDMLLGEGKYIVAMDYPNYTLVIAYISNDPQWFGEIKATIEGLIPANIIFTNIPRYSSSLKTNESISLTQPRPNYILGRWKLGAHLPFITQNVMEVIKVAGTQSIQEDLLADLAAAVKDDVSKAVINDSYEITSINKSTTDNVAKVSYVIPNNPGFTEVTRVRLYNSSDKLLSDAVVYIPLLGEATIEHVFSLSEGV